MAIEDVAKLIAPHKPDLAVKLLSAFYLRKDGLTREEVLKASELHPKMFEYLLTKLRFYRIVYGSRYEGVYRYHLSPEAFHARIDTLFVDAVKSLVGR